jgi:hypothetical protein
LSWNFLREEFTSVLYDNPNINIIPFNLTHMSLIDTIINYASHEIYGDTLLKEFTDKIMVLLNKAQIVNSNLEKVQYMIELFNFIMDNNKFIYIKSLNKFYTKLKDKLIETYQNGIPSDQYWECLFEEPFPKTKRSRRSKIFQNYSFSQNEIIQYKKIIGSAYLKTNTYLKSPDRNIITTDTFWDKTETNFKSVEKLCWEYDNKKTSKTPVSTIHNMYDWICNNWKHFLKPYLSQNTNKLFNKIIVKLNMYSDKYGFPSKLYYERLFIYEYFYGYSRGGIVKDMNKVFIQKNKILVLK